MGLFNRKKSATKEVPPEVKQYYDSEHRERVGLAWLIAFLSLILTVAVVAGLFFGGRWTYRKITHKNTSPKTGVAVNNLPTSANNPEPPSKPSGLQPTAPPPTDGGKVTIDKPQPTATPTPSTPPDNTSTDTSNQPTGAVITNTGAGDTISIFVAVSILATLAHMQYQRRKHFG